ncbi:hypothetical protein B2J93_202 [Marssonina coronariae]|uniref:Uncharacterized protein n=1 Tax=Diplocarpon coronariae TaxID=2795749 RepID=A0A218YT53_9HELO|nr:hypothetical protein B2J93_202 [Marssonina coronariae]
MGKRVKPHVEGKDNSRGQEEAAVGSKRRVQTSSTLQVIIPVKKIALTTNPSTPHVSISRDVRSLPRIDAADAASTAGPPAPGSHPTQPRASEQGPDKIAPATAQEASKATAPPALLEDHGSAQKRPPSKRLSAARARTQLQASHEAGHAQVLHDSPGDASKQQAKPKRKSKTGSNPPRAKKISSGARPVSVSDAEQKNPPSQLTSQPAVKRKPDTVPNPPPPAKKRPAPATQRTIAGHVRMEGVGPIGNQVRNANAKFGQTIAAPVLQTKAPATITLSTKTKAQQTATPDIVPSSKTAARASESTAKVVSEEVEVLSKPATKPKKTSATVRYTTTKSGRPVAASDIAWQGEIAAPPLPSAHSKMSEPPHGGPASKPAARGRPSASIPRLPPTQMLAENDELTVNDPQKPALSTHMLPDTAADTTLPLSLDKKKASTMSQASRLVPGAAVVHEPSKAKEKVPSKPRALSAKKKPGAEPKSLTVDQSGPPKSKRTDSLKPDSAPTAASVIVSMTEPFPTKSSSLKASSKSQVSDGAVYLMNKQPKNAVGKPAPPKPTSNAAPTRSVITSAPKEMEPSAIPAHKLANHPSRMVAPETSKQLALQPSSNGRTKPPAARGEGVPEHTPARVLQVSDLVPMVQNSASSFPLGIDSEVIRGADEMFAQHPLPGLPPATASLYHRQSPPGTSDDRTRAAPQTMPLGHAAQHAASLASPQSTPPTALENQASIPVLASHGPPSIPPSLSSAGVNSQSTSKGLVDPSIGLDEALLAPPNLFVPGNSLDSQISVFLETQPPASDTNSPSSPGQTLQQQSVSLNAAPANQPDLVVPSHASEPPAARHTPAQLLPSKSNKSSPPPQSFAQIAPLADPPSAGRRERACPHVQQRAPTVAATSQPSPFTQRGAPILSRTAFPNPFVQQTATNIPAPGRSSHPTHQAPDESSRPEPNPAMTASTDGQRQSFDLLGLRKDPRPDSQDSTQAQGDVAPTTQSTSSPEATIRHESSRPKGKLITIPEDLVRQIKVPDVNSALQLMRRSRLQPPLDPIYCLDVDWFLYSFAKIGQSHGDSDDRDEHVEKIQSILTKWQSVLGVALFYPDGYSASNGDDIGRIVAMRAILNRTDFVLPVVLNYFAKMQASASEEMHNATGEDYTGHPDDRGTDMSWHHSQALERAFFSRAKEGIEAICRQFPSLVGKGNFAQPANDHSKYPGPGANNGAGTGGMFSGTFPDSDIRRAAWSVEPPSKHPTPAGTLQTNNGGGAVAAPGHGQENRDHGVAFFRIHD